MNGKLSLSIAFGTALAFMSAPGSAADYVQTFEQLDVDGDGYVSAQEAEARPDLAAAMQASDTNQDGKLNSAEFSAATGRGWRPSVGPGIGPVPGSAGVRPNYGVETGWSEA